MAFARDSYTAVGTDPENFTITFPYLVEADVKVFVNGVQKTQNTDYAIVSGTTVRFSAATSVLSGGETVVIQRKTNQTARLVDYQSGANLTEEDLDNDSLQAFYMAQEAIDIADTALGLGTNDLWDANSTIIDNVGTPTAGDHAATKAYVDSVVVGTGNTPNPDAADIGSPLIATSTTAWDWGRTITADAAATKALIVKGASGQSANLQEWQNNGGSALAFITAGGNMTVTGNMTVGGDLTLTGDLLISGRGTASQSNILQNGQFNIWQTFTTRVYDPSATGFLNARFADRWRQLQNIASGTVETAATYTVSASADRQATEGCYGYLEVQGQTSTSVSAADYRVIRQLVDNLSRFDNQTVTMSFWAKADSARNIVVAVRENYGTGGSPSSEVYRVPTSQSAGGTAGVIPVTTSWVRYSAVFTLSDMSSKTFGTDSDSASLDVDLWFYNGASSGISGTVPNLTDTADVQVTGVKLEFGNVATRFVPLLMMEDLDECIPYYQVWRPGNTPKDGFLGTSWVGTGINASTTIGWCNFFFPVMRKSPTLTISNGSNAGTIFYTGGSVTATISETVQPGARVTRLIFTGSGLTAGQANLCSLNGGTSFAMFLNSDK